jgi:hypothetical protein
LSTVRASPALGFVRDTRRMNVALTRAKKCLFVVGNKSSLKQSPAWAAFLDFAASKDCVVSFTSMPSELDEIGRQLALDPIQRKRRRDSSEEREARKGDIRGLDLNEKRLREQEEKGRRLRGDDRDRRARDQGECDVELKGRDMRGDVSAASLQPREGDASGDGRTSLPPRMDELEEGEVDASQDSLSVVETPVVQKPIPPANRNFDTNRQVQDRLTAAVGAIAQMAQRQRENAAVMASAGAGGPLLASLLRSKGNAINPMQGTVFASAPVQPGAAQGLQPSSAHQVLAQLQSAVAGSQQQQQPRRDASRSQSPASFLGNFPPHVLSQAHGHNEPRSLAPHQAFERQGHSLAQPFQPRPQHVSPPPRHPSSQSPRQLVGHPSQHHIAHPSPTHVNHAVIAAHAMDILKRAHHSASQPSRLQGPPLTRPILPTQSSSRPPQQSMFLPNGLPLHPLGRGRGYDRPPHGSR